MLEINKIKKIEKVEIDGENLKIEEIIAVAKFGAQVSISPNAVKNIEKSREVLEVLISEKIIAYGINTGFGALRDKIIEEDKIEELQLNLIKSHSCSIGKPFPPEIIRGAILLRANTLAKGYSGVRLKIVNSLIELLNKNIVPFVPSKGSVGASGDLSPLSHIMLVLLGVSEGKFCIYDPKTFKTTEFIPSSPQNLKKYDFEPIKLSYKEGLALNNGTQIMTSIGVFLIYEAFITLMNAEIIGMMSLEAIKGISTSLDSKIHKARPYTTQNESASRMRKYIEDSIILTSPLNSAIINIIQQKLEKVKDKNKENNNILDNINEIIKELDRWIEEENRIAKNYKPWKISFNEDLLKRNQKKQKKIQKKVEDTINKVKNREIKKDLKEIKYILNKTVPKNLPIQDDYSFRCFPQVIGACWNAWKHVYNILSIEINSATDNPLIIPPTPPKKLTKTYKEWLKENIQKCKSSILSGGNFHGEPIGMVIDYLALAISEIGNISERRIAHLVDKNHNNGLPPFLIPEAGLYSGFMIPQYTAASLVSENKILSHPAIVDSIPTSANAENHVSMGTISCKKCLEILENTNYIISIELLTSFQALSFRKLLPSTLTQKILKTLKDKLNLEYFKKDEVFSNYIEDIKNFIINYYIFYIYNFIISFILFKNFFIIKNNIFEYL